MSCFFAKNRKSQSFSSPRPPLLLLPSRFASSLEVKIPGVPPSPPLSGTEGARRVFPAPPPPLCTTGPPRPSRTLPAASFASRAAQRLGRGPRHARGTARQGKNTSLGISSGNATHTDRTTQRPQEEQHGHKRTTKVLTCACDTRSTPSPGRCWCTRGIACTHACGTPCTPRPC